MSEPIEFKEKRHFKFLDGIYLVFLNKSPTISKRSIVEV